MKLILLCVCYVVCVTCFNNNRGQNTQIDSLNSVENIRIKREVITSFRCPKGEIKLTPKGICIPCDLYPKYKKRCEKRRIRPRRHRKRRCRNHQHQSEDQRRHEHSKKPKNHHCCKEHQGPKRHQGRKCQKRRRFHRLKQALEKSDKSTLS